MWSRWESPRCSACGPRTSPPRCLEGLEGLDFTMGGMGGGSSNVFECSLNVLRMFFECLKSNVEDPRCPWRPWRITENLISRRPWRSCEISSNILKHSNEDCPIDVLKMFKVFVEFKPNMIRQQSETVTDRDGVHSAEGLWNPRIPCWPHAPVSY